MCDIIESMSRSTELHNTSFSYENTPSGRYIVFRDPIANTELSPLRVPASIAGQPRVLAGLNYLAKLGQESEHTITIAGAPHSSNSITDNKELADLVGEHDTVFLEGLGHTMRERSLVKEIGEGRNDIPNGVFSDYALTQLAAIHTHRKFVAYADIPGDSGNYEKDLIEWGSLARPLAEQAQAERNTRIKQSLFRNALINIAGSTILREWYALSAIGNNLYEANQQGYPVNNSLVLFGTEHTKTLPRKLATLGVNSLSRELTVRSHGKRAPIDCSDFDFTEAVNNYRARLVQ